MTAPRSTPDSQLRWPWPTVYTPPWKLVATSVGFAIVAWFGATAIVLGLGGGGLPVLILLLLWASAVSGWAMRKGSSSSAALVAGAVALFSVLGTWLVGMILLVIVLSG